MLGGSNGFNNIFHITWLVILFFLLISYIREEKQKEVISVS